MFYLKKIFSKFSGGSDRAKSLLNSAKAFLMKKVPEMHLLRLLVTNEDIVVVYNMSSLDALLTAALLQSTFPKIRVVTLLDKIPRNANAYIWIGIEKHGQHSFEDLVSRDKKIQPVHFRLQRDVNDFIQVEDVYRPMSLFERVAESIKFSNQRNNPTEINKQIIRFGAAIALFEIPAGNTVYGNQAVHKHCTFSQLVLLYKLAVAAERVFLGQPDDFMQMLTTWDPPIIVCKHNICLQLDIFFDEREINHYRHEQWFQAKSKLTKQYQLLNVKDGNTVKRTVICSMSGIDYIFVRQGILLQSYAGFINMAYGANGSIVDTNIQDIKNLPIKEDFHFGNYF